MLLYTSWGRLCACLRPRSEPLSAGSTAVGGLQSWWQQQQKQNRLLTACMTEIQIIAIFLLIFFFINCFSQLQQSQLASLSFCVAIKNTERSIDTEEKNIQVTIGIWRNRLQKTFQESQLQFLRSFNLCDACMDTSQYSILISNYQLTCEFYS